MLYATTFSITFSLPVSRLYDAQFLPLLTSSIQTVYHAITSPADFQYSDCISRHNLTCSIPVSTVYDTPFLPLPTSSIQVLCHAIASLGHVQYSGSMSLHFPPSVLFQYSGPAPSSHADFRYPGSIAYHCFTLSLPVSRLYDKPFHHGMLTSSIQTL